MLTLRLTKKTPDLLDIIFHLELQPYLVHLFLTAVEVIQPQLLSHGRRQRTCFEHQRGHLLLRCRLLLFKMAATDFFLLKIGDDFAEFDTLLLQAFVSSRMFDFALK